MTEEKPSLNSHITGILGERLRYFVGMGNDHKTSLEVYMVVFNVLSDIFNNANIKLSDEGVNYLAQLYYDALSVNGQEEAGFDPNIFTQRASLKNIRTEELILYANMFKDVPPFAYEFITEIKHRS